MPRNNSEVHRKLQLAALELYQEKGYEITTATEIAARAGVTERTFFRHFSDKREVLFDGEAGLTDALISAIRAAPSHLSPWETLFRAFQSVEQLFVDNRAFSEPRRQIIDKSLALQEREQAKVRALIVALTSALVERGTPHRLASLSAQMGMAALAHAFMSWLKDAGSFEEHVLRAFSEVRAISSSGSELT